MLNNKITVSPWTPVLVWSVKRLVCASVFKIRLCKLPLVPARESGGFTIFQLLPSIWGALRFDGSSGFAAGFLFVQFIHVSDYLCSLGPQRVCERRGKGFEMFKLFRLRWTRFRAILIMMQLALVSRRFWRGREGVMMILRSSLRVRLSLALTFIQGEVWFLVLIEEESFY